MRNENLPVLSENPFTARSGITDPRFFVGRKDELQAVITCMKCAQPTSVNIVGERRIGKTSLLYHIERTWSERVENRERFVVIFLSMQEHRVHTKQDFFNTIAQELLRKPAASKDYELADALKSPVDDSKFADAMGVFEKKGILPVLLLDEFQNLFKRPEAFDDNFYEYLRAIIDKSRIMLAAATPYPIKHYKEKHNITSTFFNNGRVEYLREFKKDEAEALLRLPASTVNGALPVLNDREKQLALEWCGTNKPLFLQMAACRLVEARQNGNDEAWAKRKFIDDIKDFDNAKLKLRRELPNILQLPERIVSFIKKLGDAFSSFMAWCFIVVLIIFTILALLGKIDFHEIFRIIKEFID